MVSRLAAVALVSTGLLVVVSCRHDDWDEVVAECRGTVVRRCRTVCDYWCYGGYYGWYGSCSPVCWDQCSGSCYPSPETPDPVDAGPAPVADASATPPPPPPNDGSGVLCSPCAKTDDCQPGSVCILPGGVSDAGADAGPPGFCGQSCTTNPDCPQGYVCAQLGTLRQCLPTGGRCR